MRKSRYYSHNRKIKYYEERCTKQKEFFKIKIVIYSPKKFTKWQKYKNMKQEYQLKFKIKSQDMRNIEIWMFYPIVGLVYKYQEFQNLKKVNGNQLSYKY